MQELNLIDIINKSRQSIKSAQSIYTVINLMQQFKKTQIEFYDFHFDTEDQKFANTYAYDSIERYINAIYHNIAHSSFDYIILYSSDLENNKLIFSKNCAKRAYAIYMFMLNNYKLNPYGEADYYLHKDLANKKYEDLNFCEQSQMIRCSATLHEYTLYENEFTEEEINLLKDYLNYY